MGLAITTAVYGTIANLSGDTINLSLPYERTYLCTIIFAIFGLACVPFMNIKALGPAKVTTPSVVLEGYNLTTLDTRECLWCKQNDLQDTGTTRNFSRRSDASMATSYFPRFSWEDERELLLEREKNREANVTYEVCVKCLQETKRGSMDKMAI